MSARHQDDELSLLRWGGVAAIVGTVFQVAAGTASTVGSRGETAEVLDTLAGQAGWLWPTIYLGFIFGALLWLIALVTLAPSLPEGISHSLGRIAIITGAVGVTFHAVDGALNGAVLARVVADWGAGTGERATLMQQGDLLLRTTEGTWATVTMLFHGVPFIFAGLAVVLSLRYPAWLGWIGVLGGAGSLVVGVGKFYGWQTAVEVPFAVILSIFMIILGGLTWMRVATATATEPGLT
jgi:hypothetical protein